MVNKLTKGLKPRATREVKTLNLTRLKRISHKKVTMTLERNLQSE